MSYLLFFNQITLSPESPKVTAHRESSASATRRAELAGGDVPGFSALGDRSARQRPGGGRDDSER